MRSPGKRPDPIPFFVDRSVGSGVTPDALRNLGVEVYVHDDHFPVDCPDETWLAEVGAKGWVVLTKDRRFRYRALELEACRRAKVAIFVVGGKLNGRQMAEAFCKALPKIRRILKKYKRPVFANVSPSGEVTVIEGHRKGPVSGETEA